MWRQDLQLLGRHSSRPGGTTCSGCGETCNGAAARPRRLRLLQRGARQVWQQGLQRLWRHDSQATGGGEAAAAAAPARATAGVAARPAAASRTTCNGNGQCQRRLRPPAARATQWQQDLVAGTTCSCCHRTPRHRRRQPRTTAAWPIGTAGPHGSPRTAAAAAQPPRLSRELRPSQPHPWRFGILSHRHPLRRRHGSDRRQAAPPNFYSL